MKQPTRPHQGKTRKRPHLPDRIKRKIYERDGRACQICGRVTRFGGTYDTPWDPLPPSGSVDHIIPVSKGGTNEDTNLRWSCKSCNSARGNRA